MEPNLSSDSLKNSQRLCHGQKHLKITPSRNLTALLREKSLLNHPDVAVRDFAIETLKEIETFKISEDSYGYVFYVLQRSN
jgi:hypothetical protein